MLSTYDLRSVFEANGSHRVGGKNASFGYVGGLRRFFNWLGLTDENGVRHRNSAGEPTIVKPRINSNELTLKLLAESIGGIGGLPWERVFYEPAGRQGGRNMFSADAIEAASTSLAIQPSAFHNINAWSAAAGGLLEIKVLEAYNNPVYIADQLAETEQSQQRFELRPGVSRIGDKALEMNPGQSHPRVQFAERYMQTPRTVKFGLALEVTREAAFFDTTGGEVLRQANEMGDSLRYKKEWRILQAVMGATNTYTYGGTNYNTYATSGNWVNQAAGEFIDWTDMDEVFGAFQLMTDQEEGMPIQLSGPFDLLVMPGKLLSTKKMLTDTSMEKRTDTAANVAIGSNPLVGLFSGGSPMWSQIAYKLATTATALGGLGLSAANANVYWWTGMFKKAFGYLQNFPLDVKTVDTNDYQMIDQDLLLAVFGHEMGTPFVKDPRYVYRRTN